MVRKYLINYAQRSKEAHDNSIIKNYYPIPAHNGACT